MQWCCSEHQGHLVGAGRQAARTATTTQHREIALAEGEVQAVPRIPKVVYMLRSVPDTITTQNHQTTASAGQNAHLPQLLQVAWQNSTPAAEAHLLIG